MEIIAIAQNPQMGETIAKNLSNSNYRNLADIGKNPIFLFSSNINHREIYWKLYCLNSHPFQMKLQSSHEDLMLSLSKPFEYLISESEASIINIIFEETREFDKIFVFSDNSSDGELFAQEIQRILEDKEVLKPIFNSLSTKEIINSLNEMDTFTSERISFKYEYESRFSDIYLNFLHPYKSIFKKNANKLKLRPMDFLVLSYIYNINYDNDFSEPEEYASLELKITKDESVLTPKWARDKLFCPLTAFSIYASIINKCSDLFVENSQQYTSCEERPSPLTFSRLLYLSIKYLNESSNNIISSLESLYNKGYISYPFSEVQSYPISFDFNAIIKKIKKVPDVDSDAESLLHNFKPCAPSHEIIESSQLPIHPTDALIEIDNSLESKLYLLIVKHFLATISEDCIKQEYQINFRLMDEKFILRYPQTQDLSSWKTIFRYPFLEEKNIFSAVIPDFQKDEVLKIKSLRFIRNKVKKSILTEKSFLKFMIKNNFSAKDIADSINMLHNSGLVKRLAKSLRPTDFGTAIILAFEHIGFDFRDPFFIDLIKNAIKKENFGDREKTHIFRILFLMAQKLKSKENDFKGVLEMMLKDCSLI